MLFEKLLLGFYIYPVAVEHREIQVKLLYVWGYKNYNYDFRIIPFDLNQVGMQCEENNF